MADEPIVCNTGPLIALSSVGHLDLLQKLYRHVFVPEAVLREIAAGGDRVGASEIAAAAWLRQVPDNLSVEPLLAKELGAGEAEVITAARQLGARLVLLDERRARRIAEQAYDLRVKGSAGILVSAKRAGLIPSVRSLLEEIKARGYYLSERLLQRAVQEAGEGEIS
jgi:predicted nucleic acid-binding protein